jgi:indole-3-acetate monooxygenase
MDNDFRADQPVATKFLHMCKLTILPSAQTWLRHYLWPYVKASEDIFMASGSLLTECDRMGTATPLLLQRAKDLAPFLSAQSEANENAGRLTDDVVQALKNSKLFSLFVPTTFGGAELWPTAGLEIIEAISYADGSTGWVTMATQVSMATAAAYLKPSAANFVFGTEIPLIAGQGAPSGRAEPEGLGYRLSGSWNYGSGLLHSKWVHTGATVQQGGTPRAYPGTRSIDTRIFIVPIASVELSGNWDVLGLKATGSIDYAIENAFVAEEFTHRLTANRPFQGGDLYRLGIAGFATVGHTGFALGVARRALDEIAALALAPHRPSTMLERGGGESFHLQYGRAEAQLIAARAMVFDTWSDIEQSLARGNDLTVRQLTLARLALNHVTSVAGNANGLAFEFGGGTSLRSGAIQRCFRDQRAGAQHFTTSEFIMRECAKELLGLSAGKVWSLRQLVDPE